MSILTHQICIIGAGPVGLTLANCLALSPHVNSIALVDRKMPKIIPIKHTIPNQRVYSINGPSLQLFDRLGVTKHIRQSGNLSKIEVISKQSQCFFQWSENNAKIIENDELVSALLTNLETQKVKNKIEFIEDQIVSYQNDIYSHCEIKFHNKTLSTKLLIGSDGNKSKVKQLARIATYGWSYRQKAIVCTLKLEKLSHHQNNSAFQIYYEGNVLAFLPLWDDYVSIVWSLNIPDFQHIIQMDETTFLKSINNVILNCNQKHKDNANYIPINNIIQLVNKRLSFPLSTLQSQMYSKHRLALIGDAAHSIHPMAGLGLNSGIMDSVFLANNIIMNKKTGNDIGQAISLSDFDTQSKAMNYANSLAMQAIKQTFDVDVKPINFLRKMAIDTFQMTDIIKNTMKKLVENNPLIDIKQYEWQHI